MATAADLLQSATGVPVATHYSCSQNCSVSPKNASLRTPKPSFPKNASHVFDWIERVRGAFRQPIFWAPNPFWGRDFIVTPDVLIPRPDTETVIETVLHLVDSQKPFSILDLGTGSGAIAVTLAKELPNACVTATDISDRALAVAKENARRLGATISFT